MRKMTLAIGMALMAATPTAAGQSLIFSHPPFTQALSNTTPLAFGMTADEAAAALGAPLQYVKGRPGDETLLAIRNIGGGGLFPRDDRLFLQFRRGRLTGFKGDWAATGCGAERKTTFAARQRRKNAIRTSVRRP